VTNDIDRIKIPIERPHPDSAQRKINVGGDFTIEFQMRADAADNPHGDDAVSGENDHWTLGHVIVDRDIFGDGDYGDYGISLAENRIAFGVNNGDESYTLIGGSNVANGEWRHIAVTRNTTTGFMEIFIDGISVASANTSVTGNVSYRDGRAINTYTHPVTNETEEWFNEPYLVLGAEKHDYDNQNYPSYNGYLDELRISNIVRYTSNYTPVDRFSDDANTVALFHFEEGSGTHVGNTALASSGAVSHGTMNVGGTPVGPLWVLRGIEWIGTENSNWDNPNNWDPNTVPGANDDVVISSTTNQPVVNLPPSNPALCNGLYIRNGATLAIAPGSALTAAGTVSNTGTIIIQSDATATGSVIHNQGGVEAQVQRYIAAANWNNPSDGWHLLSSPVASQNIQPVFVPDPPIAAIDFYRWSEPTGEWINTKTSGGAWNSSFGSTFSPGVGYMVAYQDAGVRTFTGSMNASNVLVSVTNSGSNAYNGFNLIGNPYTSALLWNDGNWTLGDIGGVAYVWSDLAKDYISRSANDPIPAMNGFMVYTTSTGNLTIPTASRAHHTQNWFKNNEERIVIHAEDPQNKAHKELIIRFHPLATQGFDLEYDGLMLQGFAPQFYTLADDIALSVNTLPANDEKTAIPLGFTKNIGSRTYNLRLTEFIHDKPLFLTDLKTGQTIHFSDTGNYTFTSESGDEPMRFLLKTSGVGITDPESQQASIQAWVYGNSLFVNNQENALILEVFDISGRMIDATTLSGAGIQQQQLNYPQGFYILHLQSSKAVTTLKARISK
jgi:hypothetical protein